jgi:hypothetical protein
MITKCPECGEYTYQHIPHRCKPRWMCMLTDAYNDPRVDKAALEEWTIVFAVNWKDAAERFAEHFAAYEGTTIDELDVTICRMGEPEARRFFVTGEIQVIFRAEPFLEPR